MMTAPDSAPPAFATLYGRSVSLSLPCPGVTLMDFLGHSHGQPRFYWESRPGDAAFAGAGTAVELKAWGANRFVQIQQQAADLFSNALLHSDEPLAAPRLFGGFAFREDFIPDNTWSIYAPAYFVLPHYQLLRIGEESWLTINAQIPLEDDPGDLLPELDAALREKIAALQAPAPLEPTQNHLTEINYPMPYAVWAEKITHAVERIQAGELKKVVLARACEAQFADRVAILAALHDLADHYPECYRFLFEPRSSYAFFGATPELLVEVSGERLRTMGLAGSIRRGKTPPEDQALANELLNSAKNRHEQQVVVDNICQRLGPITKEMHTGEVEIYPLSNIQHLHTAIEAVLKDKNGVLAAVEILHPTPALGGDPRDAAMQMIRDSEPIPRGWYGAPVGWIDDSLDGQFAVAIRSAVAQSKRVWLYAGAGIVADSEPEKEWDETALKFRPMLNALGIES